MWLLLITPCCVLREQLLEGFDLSEAERSLLSSDLASRGRGRLENHVREAALTRLSRMKDR